MAEEALGELALAKVAALLAGMTGERYFGAAYPNAPIVEREFRTILQVQRYPHLIVLPGGGSGLASADTWASVGTSASFKVDFELLILGYTERTPAGPATLWAERLREDIHRTLFANLALGGIGYGVVIGEWEADELPLTAGRPQLAGFQQSVTAKLARVYAVAPGA